MKIPLYKDVFQACIEIHKVTSRKKSSFTEIYAQYAATYWLLMFCPHFINNISITMSTKPFTLVLSNIPGMLNTVTFNGKTSIKS